MSIGISIYYMLKSEDDYKLTYGYSGADINKEYDKNLLLSYDGEIEISKEALREKDVLGAFKEKDIRIIKDCTYEYHHERVKNEEEMIGFFAMKVVFKIFREFKENGVVQAKGGVVY